VVVLSSVADKRLGGHTGDTIGAAQQVAEALIFTGLSVGGTTIVL
jgi:cobalamin synthase